MAVFLASTAAYGQQDKMVSFLQTNSEVRTDTNEWQFTGRFLPIPQQLQNELLTSFPKHRFSSAEMNFVGHIPGTKYPLILITDAESGEVVGFIRQLNWGAASESFSHLFDGYNAGNKEDLEKQLFVLATLIASTDPRGSVGPIQRKKNTVSVDLQWGSGPWRRLEEQFDRHLRITRMSLVNVSNRRGFF